MGCSLTYVHRCSAMQEHPVRLLVEDDLHRNRLTVFFRLLLAIPHLIWAFLWSIADLLRGDRSTGSRRSSAAQPPAGLHRFMCGVHPLPRAPRLVPLARRQPVPGVRRRGGRVPDRRRAARSRRRRRAGRRSSGSSSRSRRSLFSSALGGGGSDQLLDGRGSRESYGSGRRARARRRRARLVREPRARPDAEGPARRRRLQRRLQRADARVPPARHRPVSERRPDGDARGRRAAARASSCTSSATRTTCAARA